MQIPSSKYLIGLQELQEAINDEEQVWQSGLHTLQALVSPSANIPAGHSSIQVCLMYRWDWKSCSEIKYSGEVEGHTSKHSP